MNRRDIELLSSYIDGQLRPSESARLEARLASDPGLRAVLEDLRSTRTLLRKLPMRKAPRNFTLTPKMVGKNPPLPRTYPMFRFVTALASIMLFFSMSINYLVPRMVSQSPAFGMGGGGAPEVLSEAAQAATEAPVEEPAIQMAPMPTQIASAAAEESAREAENPSEKEGAAGDSAAQNQPQAPAGSDVAPPVASVWLVLLGGVAALGGLIMLLMRRLSEQRWRQK